MPMPEYPEGNNGKVEMLGLDEPVPQSQPKTVTDCNTYEELSPYQRSPYATPVTRSPYQPAPTPIRSPYYERSPYAQPERPPYERSPYSNDYSGRANEYVFNSSDLRRIDSDFSVMYSDDIELLGLRISKKLLLTVVIGLAVILSSFFALNIYAKKTIKRNHSVYFGNLSNIDPPIQTETTGGTVLYFNGTAVAISYVAEYTLSGRVVHTNDYSSGSMYDRLAPRDLTIVWGFLANKDVDRHVEWGGGERFGSFKVYDTNWLAGIGGMEAMGENFSNNHVIPSSSGIGNLLDSVKTGEYVRIKGYLVNAVWTETAGMYTLNSSTVRTDTGDGACEIIFVTSVEWLK